MTDSGEVGLDALPPEVGLRVHEACNRFEAAWATGRRPDVEDYLAGATGPERAALVRELVLLDAECRRERGDTVSAADYRPLFPAGEPAWLTRELADRGRAGRYRLGDELGYGGMGAVYRAGDPELGRELAVKVLHPKYRDNAAARDRFLREAHVTARLQHPNIPPVHERGRLPDGRPYFAMKLVRGRNLHELLSERPEGDREVPRWLPVFVQVCQAVAYAHSRGVIHRDLKPHNVMVGEFGEVQVMDWGLAKPLGNDEGGGVGPRSNGVADGPTDLCGTPPSGGPDRATQSGAALGTYPYMPPEQARGAVALIDQRSDVFGLGTILCEILTGDRPYTGGGLEVVRQAEAADLAAAWARLDGCGADVELIGLAKRCLAAEQDGRPRDAGEVAAAVAAYQTGVEERARKTELERAAAQARAEEAKATAAAERQARQEAQAKARAERRARRLVVGLAAAVLLVVLAGGGGWLWVVQDRAARERAANLALGKAEQLADQAGKVRVGTVAEAEQAVVLWQQAEGQVGQAEGVLASALGAEAARARLAERRRNVVAGLRRAEEARDQARNEAKLLAELNKARELLSNWQGSNFAFESAAQTYAEVVAAYGLDVFGQEPEAVAAAIQRERPVVRLALIVALDDWAFCDKVRAPRLRRVTGLADDDGWRQRYRAAVAGDDLGELKRLAREARGQPLPALSLELLAVSLMFHRAQPEAAALLRHARGQHPADFWIHFDLGSCLYDSAPSDPATLAEALGCFWTAVALRPDSASARSNLGVVLAAQGRLDDAIAEYRKAIEIDPRHTLAHCSLGNALAIRGQFDEAAAEFRKAVAIDPRQAKAHYGIGVVLAAQGRPDDAIAEYRKAIGVNPKYAEAHNNLGLALYAKGRVEEAIAEYRKAAEADPRLANARSNLGNALAAQGRPDEAVAEYRKAIEADPKFAPARFNLGNALTAKGQLDEAIAEYREAVAIDPTYAKAHGALGRALLRRGRFAAARDATRRALDLLPERAPLRGLVTEQLRACERLLALDEKLSAVDKGGDQPADAAERLFLADLCRQYKQRYVAATRFYTDAFAADEGLAGDLQRQHRYNAACGAALAGTGKGEDSAKLSDPERSDLRQRALGWLQADLAARTKPAKTDTAPHTRKVLQDWQQTPDLAGVRDEKALQLLPEPERKAWAKLWAEVAQVLRSP